MSNCILGPSTNFGSHHSAQVCSCCGTISVFLDGKPNLFYDEEGKRLRTLTTCNGFKQEALFQLKAEDPDTLVVSRDGSPEIFLVERGDGIIKREKG
jgi:hypothetical protein